MIVLYISSPRQLMVSQENMNPAGVPSKYPCQHTNSPNSLIQVQVNEDFQLLTLNIQYPKLEIASYQLNS